MTKAKHYQWGEMCDGWHLLQTTGLSVIQERVPAGAGEVRHYHDHAQQFFYILQGQATLEFDGGATNLNAHQGAYIAPGITHRFMNYSDEDVIFLVISTPSTSCDRINVEVKSPSLFDFRCP
jgi:quercetin dioxygenase-like cupin family protein